jgi:hypothetical protein
VGRQPHRWLNEAVGFHASAVGREVIDIRDGGTPPWAHVVEQIERNRAEVRARVRHLQQFEGELAVLAEQGSKMDPPERDPAGICKVIPAEPRVAP